MRSWAAPSPISVQERTSRPELREGGRSWPGSGRTFVSRSCGATSTRGSARCPRQAPSSSLYAALERLGLTGRVAEVLATSTMLPQVGQGALAIQCRAGDKVAAELAGAIDDVASHRCVDAERAFLGELGRRMRAAGRRPRRDRTRRRGGLEGLIASLDGRVLLRRHMSGPDPVQLGRALAAEIRDRCGGAEVLFGAHGVL